MTFQHPKKYLKWVLFLFLVHTQLFCSSTKKEAEETPSRPPNVVLIFTDDQGYQDLSCYGSPDIQTPNIDQMAKRGIRFTNFYVSQPVCSASRSSLLTGCYANRLGIHDKFNFEPLPLMNQDTVWEYLDDQSQLTTQYTEHAVSFIERNKDQPFFLYVPHSMPHVPLFVSDKFKGKSARGLYGDVIEEIDWSVGEILKSLEENGLTENTLVIFTSDNGPWLNYGEHSGEALPLREGKGTAWEGGVRVPCVMQWPGNIPAGIENSLSAMTIDVLPTIAEITGADLPTLPIDGKSILPMLKGNPDAETPHEAYYFYYNTNELHAVPCD
ncbi:UNVERIFIED_CONTAM: hypothetical protein GTU68_051736 [Idotea baltica]|nr:hypothetical protein [Idotea baltica]